MPENAPKLNTVFIGAEYDEKDDYMTFFVRNPRGHKNFMTVTRAKEGWSRSYDVYMMGVPPMKREDYDKLPDYDENYDWSKNS
jgi:hypothetical protein